VQTNWATGNRRVIYYVFVVLEWTMQYGGRNALESTDRAFSRGSPGDPLCVRFKFVGQP